MRGLLRAVTVLSLAVAAGACRAAGPAAPLAYVTNEVSGDLSIIDTAAAAVVATVPLGKRPRGIKASPDGRFLYIALSGSPIAGPNVDPDSLPPADRSADGIGEVDTASRTLVRVIHADADPEQLDITADGARLFVANEDTAQVSVVDVKSGSIVATAPVGSEPEGVTIRPDGKVVYVTSEGDGDVAVIDTATFKVLARVPVGHRPRSIGFLPDGSRAFVSLENDGALAVVDARRHTLMGTVQLGDPGAARRPRPMGVAVAADGSVVYTTTGSFGRLLFVNPTTGAPTGSIEVGQRPWGVALLPDGRTLYTANGPSNDVSVVDLASRQVVKRIPVGTRPWGVVVTEGGRRK